MVDERVQADVGHLDPGLHDTPVPVPRVKLHSCRLDNDDKLSSVALQRLAQVYVRFGQGVSRGLQPVMVLGFPRSSGFWMIVGSRMVGAVGEGFGGTVMGIMGGPAWQALVADLIPADRRGRVMGLMGTLVGLLSLPASWVGGYLYDNVSPQAPFYASFVLGVTATIIFILLVSEPERRE